MTSKSSGKDLAIIIVNRNRPDLTDALVEQLQPLGSKVSKDIFVIECGSDPDRRSRYESFSYEDPDFSGKCYGHNRGLDWVLENHGRYRHYWALMNDLVFTSEPDPIGTLVEILDSEPRMGIVSPTERDSHYLMSKPRPGRRWHKVPTTDYLALMIKDECLQECGFLNRDFKYCWGAIHELSYQLYRRGWFIAYCDEIVMKHLGGTTYGKAAKTIKRNEYIYKARKWAAEYFVDTYGNDWDRVFAACLPPDVQNTYDRHRRYWEAYDEPDVPEEDLQASGGLFGQAYQRLKRLVQGSS